MMKNMEESDFLSARRDTNGHRAQLINMVAKLPTRNARPRVMAICMGESEVMSPKEMVVKEKHPTRPERYTRIFSACQRGEESRVISYGIRALSEPIHHRKHKHKGKGPHDERVPIASVVSETAPYRAKYDADFSQDKIFETTSGTIMEK